MSRKESCHCVSKKSNKVCTVVLLYSYSLLQSTACSLLLFGSRIAGVGILATHVNGLTAILGGSH